MPFVYLIGNSNDSNVYKIGVAKNIEKRLKQLQTGNDEEIYLVNSYETSSPFNIEKMFHTYFANKKILNEWFYLNKEDIDKFPKLCEMFQKNVNALKDNCFFKVH